MSILPAYGHRTACEHGDEATHAERSGGSHHVVEAEEERSHDQPHARGEVEPLSLAFVQRRLEMRAERQPEAEEYRVGRGRRMCGVAGNPGRNREPQAERKARPLLLPPGCGRHIGHTSKIWASSG